MPTSPSPSSRPKKIPKKPTTSDTVAKVIVFLMMAFFGVAVNMVSYNDFVSIKDDLWLNSHGTLARNPYLSVHHGRRGSGSLCAYYDTQQGKSYSKCTELWFPLIFIDEHSPEIVHYNPASPEHISTSWGRQILFSRTFSLLVALLFAVIIDFGVLVSLIEKVTGAKLSPVSPSPVSLTSSQSDPSGEASAEASSSLQASALKLANTLDRIVTNLESNAGPNAAYARASAAELAPLVAHFHGAVLAHSREQASDALNSIVEFMNGFVADTRQRKIGFGFRHWLAMRTYDDLHDIFRDSKHRNATL
jgi:hypothetical protein